MAYYTMAGNDYGKWIMANSTANRLGRHTCQTLANGYFPRYVAITYEFSVRNILQALPYFKSEIAAFRIKLQFSNFWFLTCKIG